METIIGDAHAGAVSPELVVDALFACRKTAAIRAAIELDLFTHIGEGKTPAVLGSATGASERGVRILCDYLVVHGFLTKEGERYRTTPSTRMFLDRNSPAYMGSAVEFVAAPEVLDNFLRDPAAIVRNGGSAGLANMSPDNPVWLKFARGMGSFTGLSAKLLAGEISGWPVSPKKVLDIAAGPGVFGIEIAKAFPSSEIVAVDWGAVLELSRQNAEKAGVADGYRTIAGSAFDVEWGTGYDLVLLPNFLHHFDLPTCAELLRKIIASLAKDGRIVAVDFVPNEDGVSPPFPAAFSWEMLASTPAGQAYKESELAEMAKMAGLAGVTVKPMPPTPASLILFE
ncbi:MULTISPECIES: methyltransferase [Rhizobium]|uniref:methyltransferase n=1 Tax=Rhizobium TaxID=379 RepID=UPI00110721B0|nr:MULTISPECIES: class I SAM-dependent methyltransferase [Rhizobium]MBX4896325.1 methyltransferase domain-containing protein [Rhizobium bangladeshense]MBX4902182.1 methyltransferase domain-containing protein [Rhizobium bangladeshense]MBY3613773.1 methyltransferase domain-containing protein [Rhizobium bangladeshense]QSY95098.1 methyltransferase domain-containing protein [Rhizobium bangladeshense]TLX13308.1 methyltransferase domain-containing protein [Rhizobium sp. MHM7A]